MKVSISDYLSIICSRKKSVYFVIPFLFSNFGFSMRKIDELFMNNKIVTK